MEKKMYDGGDKGSKSGMCICVYGERVKEEEEKKWWGEDEGLSKKVGGICAHVCVECVNECYGILT